MSQTFRILSLSGGGVRGIFQAVFLRKLTEQLGPELRGEFDLVAGTSTGAIMALAFALNVPADEVVRFYRERAPSIFKAGFLADFCRGPKYRTEPLRQCLNEVFASKTLADSEKSLIIAATTVDRFQHRIFSNLPQLNATDGALSAVDVALASAAAPTYFAPVQPSGGERTYVDGGVWANSPSLLAILVAHRHLNIPLEDIRVLSIGTGYFPNGRRPQEMRQLRPLSVGTVRAVWEMIADSQTSFSDEYAEVLLGAQHFLKIDAPLSKNMELDDVPAALNTLPPLAEREAADKAQQIRTMFLHPSSLLPARSQHKASHVLTEHLIPAAGLSAFYPSRDFYRFRGAASIDRYVATATKSIVMISINLMTGVPFDGLCEVLKRKVEDNEGFSVVISLLDPDLNHLMASLSSVLNMTPLTLADSIHGSLDRLRNLKRSLVLSAQGRLSIRVHRAIPLGSAILLDHREVHGRIQIETKIYKAPVRRSFAFEVVPTNSDDLYSTLAKGYEDLLQDGEEVSMERGRTAGI